ncbi:hypothetical protein EMCRGX_G005342 [Ephydatia muelleri]
MQTPEKKRSAKRERYHADPEKKRSAKRERYHADPEKKRSAKRESYEADPAKKQTEERERYHADPEKKRSAERKRYWEGPECARLARYGKAKRTLQNQRGHRKRATDKVIQRKKAGEFLKDVRAINAIKLEDSHLLEGVRYHTAGSEPFFYDASYNHTRQLGAIPVDLNGRVSFVLKVMFPGSTSCHKLDTTLRGSSREASRSHLEPARNILSFPGSWRNGHSCVEDEAHMARVIQAFTFLADQRDPTIRAVALHQLAATMSKRAKHLEPTNLEHMAMFLNPPTAEGIYICQIIALAYCDGHIYMPSRMIVRNASLRAKQGVNYSCIV